MKKRIFSFISVALTLIIVISCFFAGCEIKIETNTNEYIASVYDVPDFSNQPYVAIKDNIPDFSESDYTTVSYEEYSELDELGRCGVTIACIGIDIMPTQARGSIGQVKPTGWQTVKYDNVDGKYLYNRCHLIGYQLTGENANIRNLITGTRYLNVNGMLPFENMVADYVKETKNHVIYRVTPIFYDNNLVANGVQMEAYSVEDKGDGICFNVYCYNNQPGISINYLTGESCLGDNVKFKNESQVVSTKYIINTNSQKFHLSVCKYASDIRFENREEFSGDRYELLNKGYTPCKYCNP